MVKFPDFDELHDHLTAFNDGTYCGRLVKGTETGDAKNPGVFIHDARKQGTQCRVIIRLSDAQKCEDVGWTIEPCDHWTVYALK